MRLRCERIYSEHTTINFLQLMKSWLFKKIGCIDVDENFLVGQGAEFLDRQRLLRII
jgi:hypothetical protein